jgi:hypothetical protein
LPRQSALERAAYEILKSVRINVGTTDRAVLLGLILACIPIFPACLVGTIICILNFLLIKKKKLSLTEEKFVKIGSLIGVCNTFLWIFFLYQFGNLMFWPIEFWQEILGVISLLIYDIFNGTAGVGEYTTV